MHKFNTAEYNNNNMKNNCAKWNLGIKHISHYLDNVSTVNLR